MDPTQSYQQTENIVIWTGKVYDKEMFMIMGDWNNSQGERTLMNTDTVNVGSSCYPDGWVRAPKEGTNLERGLPPTAEI